MGVEKDKATKRLGGLAVAASMIKDLVRLTILRLLYLKSNMLHFIPHKELTKKLTKIMLGESLVITNSKYYELLAPEIMKTIQDKFTQKSSNILPKNNKIIKIKEKENKKDDQEFNHQVKKLDEGRQLALQLLSEPMYAEMTQEELNEVSKQAQEDWSTKNDS